jgi:molecular chaperone DnaK (HSP70)
LPATVNCDVLIDYEDVDGPSTERASLSLVLALPPELTLEEGYEPPKFYQPGVGAFDLTFSNRKSEDPFDGRNNAPVRIQAIDLEHESEELREQWADQFVGPIVIAGGDAHTARFNLDLASFPLGEGPPEVFSIRVAVKTNRAQVNFSQRIDFLLNRIPIFRGCLALDFGTSNTCCYTMENGNIKAARPIQIDLDPGVTSSPTVLRYKRILGGAFAEVEIGQLVKKSATLAAASARATLSRLKERLGEPQQFIYVKATTAELGMTRTVTQAVVDYLREIRKIAEQKTNCYYRDIIVTHPAVCSLQQYRNLTTAVREAFGKDTDVTFLQEPVASLIPLVRDQARQGTIRPQYCVAAFDFGGGTTDITVARIEQSRAGKHTEVRLSLISSWGERWGGEHLTDFLVERLLKRCEKKEPLRTVMISGDPATENEDERLNRLVLHDWAEQWKINAAEAKPFTDPFSLRVARPSGVPETVDFAGVARDLLDDKALGEEYEAYLDERLADLVRRLKADLSNHEARLDILQLSGKSSGIPQVYASIKKAFAGTATQINLLKPNELKECVVKGACLWKQMCKGSSLVLDTPFDITTSRLGFWDAGASRFEEIVPLGWPIEKPSEPYRYRWSAGQKSLELAENLGEQYQEEYSAKRANLQITHLGSFEPQQSSSIGNNRPLTLRVTVTKDFLPQLSATTEDGVDLQFAWIPAQKG